MSIILPILIFLLTLVGKLLFDSHQGFKKRNAINTKSITNHPLETVFVVICLIGSGILFAMHLPLNWAVTFLIIFFMQFFVFWTLFDGGYNKLRGFNFWFNGSRDPDDSKLDRVLMAMPKWMQICLKLLGCITFIWLYIQYYK